MHHGQKRSCVGFHERTQHLPSTATTLASKVEVFLVSHAEREEGTVGLRSYQRTCQPARNVSDEPDSRGKVQQVEPEQNGVIKEYFQLGIQKIHFYREKSFPFHNFKPVNQQSVCAIYP